MGGGREKRRRVRNGGGVGKWKGGHGSEERGKRGNDRVKIGLGKKKRDNFLTIFQPESWVGNGRGGTDRREWEDGDVECEREGRERRKDAWRRRHKCYCLSTSFAAKQADTQPIFLYASPMSAHSCIVSTICFPCIIDSDSYVDIVIVFTSSLVKA